MEFSTVMGIASIILATLGIVCMPVGIGQGNGDVFFVGCALAFFALVMGVNTRRSTTGKVGLALGALGLEYAFPIESDALNVGGVNPATSVMVRRESWASHQSLADLSALPTVFDLPVPRGGFAQGSPAMTIEVVGDGLGGDATNALNGPGYLVVSADGQAVRTAPDALPPLAGAVIDPGAGAGGEPPGPVDPPPVPDPCAGACTEAQVCVAGACVVRAQQTQSEACYAATRACDADEDEDCAEGHACAAGLCVRRSCQVQSEACYGATRTCDAGDDGDCADGHACVGGLCRRLSCQTQSEACYAATRQCDDDDDADCAPGHACAAGKCARLSCQVQSEACYAATRVCDAGDDDDCAADHTCRDGVCHRDACH